jgi:hypothetical protein
MVPDAPPLGAVYFDKLYPGAGAIRCVGGVVGKFAQHQCTQIAPRCAGLSLYASNVNKLPPFIAAVCDLLTLSRLALPLPPLALGR